MNLDNLKIWLEAVEAADAANRPFDLSVFSEMVGCGFVGCAVGDLAFYQKSIDAGWSYYVDSDTIRLHFKGEGPNFGIQQFLETDTFDAVWVESLVFGRNAVYDRVRYPNMSQIPRSEVILLLKAKIAEIEKAHETA